jgi:hypothetical protein
MDGFLSFVFELNLLVLSVEFMTLVYLRFARARFHLAPWRAADVLLFAVFPLIFLLLLIAIWTGHVHFIGFGGSD